MDWRADVIIGVRDGFDRSVATNRQMLKAERKDGPLDAPATGEADTEQAMLDALRRGDPIAARAFYDRYAARLYRFIFRSLAGASAADAEDLLQETLMALAERVPYFRGDSSIFTFACAIARRRVASFVRTNSRRLRLAGAMEGAPDGMANENVRAAETVAALNTMSPEYREVLLLKYVEELSVAEIASILAVTEHAVESRLARARRALAKKLGVAQ